MENNGLVQMSVDRYVPFTLPIGTTFVYNGIILIVEKEDEIGQGCDGCYNEDGTNVICCMMRLTGGDCCGSDRTDNISVVFKRVENDGEIF